MSQLLLLFALANSTYLSEAETPIAIEDKYCGAYVVWHAFRCFGADADLAEVIEALEIGDDGTSLGAVAEFIQSAEIATEVAQVNIDLFRNITQPVVVGKFSSDPGELGHVVLCLPSDHDTFVVLNGVRVEGPYDLSDIASALVNKRIMPYALILGKDVRKSIIPWPGVLGLSAIGLLSIGSLTINGSRTVLSRDQTRRMDNATQ